MSKPVIGWPSRRARSKKDRCKLDQECKSETDEDDFPDHGLVDSSDDEDGVSKSTKAWQDRERERWARRKQQQQHVGQGVQTDIIEKQQQHVGQGVQTDIIEKHEIETQTEELGVGPSPTSGMPSHASEQSSPDDLDFYEIVSCATSEEEVIEFEPAEEIDISLTPLRVSH